ncbi:MAG: hypothetical protein QM536_09030 [Chitinophagaceae bacterium]|nr:hypothetical protein [Chitinophagaceae bacterium]
MIKQFISIAIITILCSNNIHAQNRAKKKANADTENWRYEIEAAGTGVQGTYLIKVWSYSKKPTIAIQQAKKNAVHGIIFKGFAGIPNVSGQKPLVTDMSIAEQKESFFDDFFSDPAGDYIKFVSESGDGSVDAGDRLKIGKEYKIGVIVSVNSAELRKYLEKAGIIKSLSDGF